jgi:hypothetical protein
MMICAFCATLVGCSLTQFITDLIAALLSTKSVLEPPETWMVPEAAVSNPPRSSRRCSSPSTVDSAARRACQEQPGEYADSLVAKAQVRATLATISDDAYNEYLDLRSLEEMREEVAGTPSPESRDWLKDDDE